MENRQLLGILGSPILFVGVFVPIVSVPIMGNLNYFQNGKGDSSLILVLAIISFVLTLMHNYRGLWFTSGGALLVMLLTFMNFHSKIDELKTELGGGTGYGLFRGLADMAVQSIQLQWGWALLLAAAPIGGATITPQTIRLLTRNLNLPTINCMPVLVGLGGLVILFLTGVLWNMHGGSSPVSTASTASQTDQTIQQLQQQNAMQDTQQQRLQNVQQEADDIRQQAEQEEQHLVEATRFAADPSALNIQLHQGNNQQPVSDAAAREELVAFFQRYYSALETNDVPAIERLWNMSVPHATKSINIVKNRAQKDIRGGGCSISTAQIRSFTPSPILATIYIDATCDVNGVKKDRFQSSFDLEKSFMGC